MSTFELVRIIIEILALLCGLYIIFSKNPVHSVFFLVLFVCFLSFLLFLLNVDFVAFVLLIVYVGAVVVLFLFVVMMINIRIIENSTVSRFIVPFTLLSVSVFFLLFSFKLFFLERIPVSEELFFLPYIDYSLVLETVSSIDRFGLLLYTYYFIPFLLLGFLLFFSMVAAIYLVLHTNLVAKRQNLFNQVSQDLISSVRLDNF